MPQHRPEVNPTKRHRELYARFEECFKRADGGLSFKVEDLLLQLRRFDELELTDEQVAEAWGTPADFVALMRAAGSGYEHVDN